MNNNLAKSPSKNLKSDKSQSEFDTLAQKLRLQKFDKTQIQKIKHDAVLNEKIKNKRKKNALRIQKFFRGYLVRKKFKNIM